ncbi:MAG: PepSY-like domain-containing protein [Cytophagales bacterium]|nr:PepSY-like domain-containing protein [Cytophagales bacterium]
MKSNSNLHFGAAIQKVLAAGTLGALLAGYGCSGKSDKPVVTAEAVVAYEVPANEAAETKPAAGAGNKTGTKLARDQVPQVVVAGFEEEFPVAEFVDWYSYPVFYDDWGWYTLDPVYEVIEKVPAYYLVEFTESGTPRKTIFNKKGEKAATRRTVKEADLPKAVTDGLHRSAFKDWKVVGEREEVTRHRDKQKVYKLEVEKGTEKRFLFFDPAGKLMHETTPLSPRAK